MEKGLNKREKKMKIRLNLRGHLGFPTKVDKKKYDIVGDVDISLDKEDKDFQKEMKALMKLPKKLLITFLIHSKTIDIVYKKFRKEVNDEDIDFAKLCHVSIFYSKSDKGYLGSFHFDLLRKIKK